MIVQQCSGVLQVVLNTVKMKTVPLIDEARERQLSMLSKKESDDDVIDPFSHEIRLTVKDWIILALGTVFLVPFRAVFVILGFCLAWILAKIGLAGLHEENNEARGRTGWRLKLMHWYRYMGLIILWGAGFRVKVIGQQASRAEAPILVGAPHSSFLDALIIYMVGSSPVSRHENRRAFLISACQIFYQAMFVDRRTSETRQKALDDICTRARSTDNNLPQLFVCPEGTNTNRRVLIQFKVGAFAPGVPVQPVLIRYPGTDRVDPVTWTYHQDHTYKFSVWLLLANPVNRVTVEFLPVYRPTKEEVADSKLYATNVQKTMAAALGIPATDITYSAQYKEYCRKNDALVDKDEEKKER